MRTSLTVRSSLLALALVAGACKPGDKNTAVSGANPEPLPAGADLEAVTLMRSVEKEYASLKTLKVESHESSGQLYLKRDSLKSNTKLTLWLGRPNKFREESEFTFGGGHANEPLHTRTGTQLRVSDGTNMELIGVMGNGCLKVGAPTMSARSDDGSLDPQVGTFYGLNEHLIGTLVRGYWASDMRLQSAQFRSLRIVGTDTLQGKNYTVVEWKYYVDYSMPDDDNLHTTRFYIGPDKLIHKITTNTPAFTGEATFTLHPNEAIPEEKFTTLPAGTKCTTPPPMAEQLAKLDPIYVHLPVGAQAPDFTLKDAVSGKEYTLKGMLAGKKALILDFLSYG